MDHEQREIDDRRKFLAAAGRFAAITPPAITMLLSTSLTSDAIASSGGRGGKGNNGYGNGGGDGSPMASPTNMPRQYSGACRGSAHSKSTSLGGIHPQDHGRPLRRPSPICGWSFSSHQEGTSPLGGGSVPQSWRHLIREFTLPDGASAIHDRPCSLAHSVQDCFGVRARQQYGEHDAEVDNGLGVVVIVPWD